MRTVSVEDSTPISFRKSFKFYWRIYLYMYARESDFNMAVSLFILHAECPIFLKTFRKGGFGVEV
jgi:hypothetical protein